MRNYEMMVVLQPNLDDDGINGVVTVLGEQLTADGGEITFTGQLADRRGAVAEVEEGWKTRRLAYPIQKHFEGYYVVLRFASPPTAIDEMERLLRVNEDVLRFLTIREDE